MAETITDAEKLLALEAIKQLKARYFRCMDTKDWAGYADVFAPDAVMDMRSENRTGNNADDQLVTGNQNIAEFLRRNVGDVTTVHHGHTPEITLTGPDSATGIWAMEDQLRWPDGGPLKTLSGYGHYHETYVRLGGRWYIKSTRLTRLRVDVT